MRVLFIALLVSASALLLASCGDDSTSVVETPTQTTQVSSPTPSTTSPTAVSGATSEATTTKGDVLDRAVRVAPYELEGVRYGGVFRSSDVVSPPHFDPKLIQAGVMTGIANWFYEKPFAFVANPNNEFATLSPLVAESWKTSPDLKTYTVVVRKGIKWHNIAPVNGREVTADDLVYSMRRYTEKDSITLDKYGQVESINAVDKYTLNIQLKEPNAWAISDLFGVAQYVVAREVVEESGGTIKEKLVGTGPYILSQYSFRQTIRGVRNPDYWQKDAKGNRLPYTDEITVALVSDQGTMVAALRTGQLDRTAQLVFQGILDVGKTVPSLRVFNLGIGTAESIAFNTRKAPWNDVRVRRAFGMLLDQAKYSDIQWGGRTALFFQSTPLPWGFVSDEPFTFAKLGPYYQFNPTEAKKLLAEAGFPDGKMKIATSLVNSYPGRSANGVLLQQLYKTQGIDFEIQEVDGSTFGTQYYQRVHQDIAHSFQISPDYNLNWFAQNKFLPDAIQNTSWINDPQVIDTVRQVKIATDPAKIREYAKFLWDYDTLGMWNIWIPNNSGMHALSPRVRNYTIRYGAGGQQYFPWLTDASRTSP